jgi:phosphatidylglycerophosphate synthase
MPQPFKQNSLDNILIYSLLEKNPDMCRLTPNNITFINILLTIIILRLLYIKNHIIILLILVIISRILDCMDGTVARTCNKYSIIGNFLDHINDAFLVIVPLLIILYKYPNTNIIMKIIIIFALMILTFISTISATKPAVIQKNIIYNNKLIIFLHDNSIITYILYALFIFYFKDLMQALNISI